MSEVITAVYEKGVLRLLEELPLEEHQTVLLKIISGESVVKETKGMFKIAPQVLKEIAESEELLEMGEWTNSLLPSLLRGVCLPRPKTRTSQ